MQQILCGKHYLFISEPSKEIDLMLTFQIKTKHVSLDRHKYHWVMTVMGIILHLVNSYVVQMICKQIQCGSANT